MAPSPAETGVAPNTIEVRFTGGMLALNRFLMTLQNKRMPVAGFTLGREAKPDGMRATIVLDCPPESALRYTSLIAALEDVHEAGPAEATEVVLLRATSDWRGAAERAGVGAHESGGTVVASGEPEKIEEFLSSLGDGAEETVRLGPVARPAGEPWGGV